jgi:tubulin monoglycylase TTLL3/8
MIDERLKVWLIEVNTNPSLKTNCQVLRNVIPKMIEDTFKICIDPLFPPPYPMKNPEKYKIQENYFKENGFQLIFDETEDRIPL